MSTERILIVDDERNIRLTVGRALERLGVEVLEAVTGEEAVELLKKERVSLVMLDLKMPGMDGMAVLRELRRKGDDVKVLIITAHGTIDNAVEAMKLGAVDFIQKPFTPEEIRSITEKALKRKSGFFKRITFDGNVAPEMAAPKARVREIEPAPPLSAEDFDHCLEQTKAAIERRDFDGAIPWLKKAISVDPSRPEGFNIFGVLSEMNGDILQAQKYYRAALSVDPTYEPASHNLSRTTQRSPELSIDLGSGGSPAPSRPTGERRSKRGGPLFRRAGNGTDANGKEMKA